ncbi:unnamed protein product [Protopolystoma xenopodis]|uniref:Tyrosine-protein phosphatase domain-containing protein n=1 Tax=Protopolystoma xenopodis TaxID=117903 RepID=A0A3S5CCP3_9PLAT|nr:unnamed protein product [Protopolystoma xenopodis]
MTPYYFMPQFISHLCLLDDHSRVILGIPFSLETMAPEAAWYDVVKRDIDDLEPTCLDQTYTNSSYIPEPYNCSNLESSKSGDILPSQKVWRYIATQAPMGHTIGDFWRMVAEQHSRIIVMLTG